MPFQFTPYSSPFVGSISELMQEPARAHAAAAIASGNAFAQAANQTGQAVSGAIQQATDPRRQLEMEQLAEAKQRRADLEQIDQAFKSGSGRDVILGALPGHLRPQVQSQFDSMDKLHAEAQEAQEKADALSTEAFADTGATIKAHSYDPSAAQIAISDLKSRYQNNPSRLKQLQQAEAAIQQNPTPQTVQSIVDPLIDASKKRVELQQAQQRTDVEAANSKESARHNAETERISGLSEGRAEAAATETARHDKEMERLQGGAHAETVRHNKAQEAANNPLAALTGQPNSGPQTQGPTGEEFLKSIPENVSRQVKALAEGRMAFPSGMALKTPYWQSMLQMVGQYDPNFDQINYNARSKTRQDFTAGKSATQVNAINTVLGHLDKLSDAAEGLNNTDFPMVNTALNALSKAVGRPNVTNFDTIKKAVADEVTRVWRQAGGSVEDIRAAQENLSAAGSPDQLRGAIATYGELLKSKLDSFAEQYKQGMGTAPVSLLRPESQAVLDKIAKRAAGGDSAPTVEEWERGPDGKLHKKGSK